MHQRKQSRIRISRETPNCDDENYFMLMIFQAVGEPPLFLASSIYFAIKEAIKAARIESGESPYFELQAPATCARIRMACEDDITKQVVILYIGHKF